VDWHPLVSSVCVAAVASALIRSWSAERFVSALRRNLIAERVREGLDSGQVGMKALALDDNRWISMFTLKLSRHKTQANKVCHERHIRVVLTSGRGAQISGLTDGRHLTSLHLFHTLAWSLAARKDTISHNPRRRHQVGQRRP
jgi:hypothetical protein